MDYTLEHQNGHKYSVPISEVYLNCYEETELLQQSVLKTMILDIFYDCVLDK